MIKYNNKREPVVVHIINLFSSPALQSLPQLRYQLMGDLFETAAESGLLVCLVGIIENYWEICGWNDNGEKYLKCREFLNVFSLSEKIEKIKPTDCNCQ